jgi:hypothetical protein
MRRALGAPLPLTSGELAGWRLRLGLNQGELAGLLGLHRLTVHGWERTGTNIPQWLRPALIGLEQMAKDDQAPMPELEALEILGRIEHAISQWRISRDQRPDIALDAFAEKSSP